MATKPRSKDMEAISKVLPHLSTATISNSISMAAINMAISNTTNSTALRPTVDSSTASMAAPNMADLPHHSNRHSQSILRGSNRRRLENSELIFVQRTIPTERSLSPIPSTGSLQPEPPTSRPQQPLRSPAKSVRPHRSCCRPRGRSWSYGCSSGWSRRRHPWWQGWTRNHWHNRWSFPWIQGESISKNRKRS